MALGAQVRKISEYKTGTLEDEEVRYRTLDILMDLERETTQLLGQANVKLERFNDANADYKSYEKQTKDADIWFQYQQILTDILYEIDNLTYTLYLGKEPKEKCFKLFREYYEMNDSVLRKLNTWHDNVCDKLQIDISENRMRRKGFRWLGKKIDTVSNWNLTYKKMDNDVVKMIEHQLNGPVFKNEDNPDLFQEDVTLIKKDGKIYYLPCHHI